MKTIKTLTFTTSDHLAALNIYKSSSDDPNKSVSILNYLVGCTVYAAVRHAILIRYIIINYI